MIPWFYSCSLCLCVLGCNRGAARAVVPPDIAEGYMQIMSSSQGQILTKSPPNFQKIKIEISGCAVSYGGIEIFTLKFCKKINRFTPILLIFKKYLQKALVQVSLSYVFVFDILVDTLDSLMASNPFILGNKKARDGAHEVRGTSVLRGPERSVDSEPMHVCMGS